MLKNLPTKIQSEPVITVRAMHKAGKKQIKLEGKK